MKRRATLYALLFAGAALGVVSSRAQTPPPASPPAAPAAPDITVVLQGNQVARRRLAFPALKGLDTLPAAAHSAAQELEQTLRDDLADSGVLDLQGPADFTVLTLSGDPAADRLQYQSLGNELLLLGEVRMEADRLLLEARLVDLKSGQEILAKRYRAALDLTRQVAHKLSDEIVLYLSGKPGIAQTAISFSSDRDSAKEIYLMDADGHNQRRITGHRSISMSPAWAPGNGAIAYVSFFEGPPGMFLVDLANGAKRRLLADGPLNTSPSFSPDGRRVAFSRSVSGNIEIFLCNLDGSGLRRLTTSAGIDTNPAWSPKGGEIAFTSSRAGNPHVYLMGADGSNVRRITFEGDYNDGAAWSPDLTQIAYARRRGNLFDIAVTNLVDLASRQITGGGGSKETPTYSPDGRKIAFAWDQRGSRHIWVSDVAGGNPRQLTTEGDNFGPEWSGYPQAAGQ